MFAGEKPPAMPFRQDAMISPRPKPWNSPKAPVTDASCTRSCFVEPTCAVHKSRARIASRLVTGSFEVLVLVLALALSAAPCCRAQQPAPAAIPARPAHASYDLVIVNGHMIDGTGSPWYSGDLGHG